MRGLIAYSVLACVAGWLFCACGAHSESNEGEDTAEESDASEPPRLPEETTVPARASDLIVKLALNPAMEIRHSLGYEPRLTSDS
jgi:hypothetical protein